MPSRRFAGVRPSSFVPAAALGLSLLATSAQAVPVAHWSFDETSGTVVADSVRPLQPGTLFNVQPGTSHTTPGIFNTGITLTNGADYVGVPRINLATTSFTIAGWVNPTTLANGDEIFGDWSDPWQFRLFLNSNGTVSMSQRRDGPLNNNGNIADVTSPATAAGQVEIGQWSHVAMTWDRNNKTAALWVDGTKVAHTTTVLANVDMKDGNHAEYQIGWKRDDSNRYDGSLDELWVFNEALNQVQINALKNQNLAVSTKLIDLADIVGGGNGTLPGTGTASGINAANGAVNQPNTAGNNTPAVAGQYNLVSYSAVDGVFVPNGTLVGGQQITSAGHTFNFAGSADAGPAYAFLFNGVNGSSDPSNQNGLPNFSGDPLFHSLLSAHAQKGITFDLDAIEAANGLNADRFTSWIGESRAQTSASAIDYFVLIDGVVVASGFDLQNTETFLDIAIPINARFLTLVTTNSANGNGSDHSYWGDPFLQLNAVIPEPASAALGLIGLSALALRRRRTA